MDYIKKFKAGFVQFDVKLGAVDHNLYVAMKYINELGQHDVKLALLPEMYSCGFDNQNLAFHAQKTPDILNQISKIAVKNNMIIAGSLPEASDKGIFNSLYIIDCDGSIAGSYRKIHLFSITDEDKYFAAGNKNVVCNTSVGPIGLMICYDLRFPELCRALTLQGAVMVIIPAQWPEIRISRWDILAQARAVENQIYIIGANRCGIDKNTKFNGHSIIIDPSGEVLKLADNGESCAWYADIDFNKVEKVRTSMPSLKERNPDAYRF